MPVLDFDHPAVGKNQVEPGVKREFGHADLLIRQGLSLTGPPSPNKAERGGVVEDEATLRATMGPNRARIGMFFI